MAEKQLMVQQKQITDIVENKIHTLVNDGQLDLPANYSPGNAMRSAFLKLQDIQTKDYKPALEVATKDSIANALLSMIVQGLNPEKNQGYFIMYGKKLTFQRSYFGTMAVTKRVTGALDIVAQVIYDGDDVTYEVIDGKIKNLQHKQKFGNINKDKIIGAYATIIIPNDRENYIELMTFEEIQSAWQQSQMWGKDQKEAKKGSTHDKFAQEMAKKTAINRACKNFINSSDDSSVIQEYFQHSKDEMVEGQVQEEIDEKANSEYFDGEFEVVEEDKNEEPVPEQTENDVDPF